MLLRALHTVTFYYNYTGPNVYEFLNLKSGDLVVQLGEPFELPLNRLQNAYHPRESYSYMPVVYKGYVGFMAWDKRTYPA